MTEELVFPSYEDNDGRRHRASDEVQAFLHRALGTNQFADASQRRGRAFLPDGRTGLSGLSVQLYALRREGDWGVGDFTALGDLLEWGAEVGLDLIGINPLHALQVSRPEACSPYYPSSRLALNPVYIDVDALADELGAKLGSPEIAQSSLIDYPAVVGRKVAALRALADDPALREPLSQFRDEAPPAVWHHVLHEAHLQVQGRSPDFAAGSEEASFFAHRHPEDIRFNLFLQWAANRQLRRAERRGRGKCRTYLDLAVGAAPDGSEVWSAPSAYVRGVRLGAPPDQMASGGQDWGLMPLNPAHLAEEQGGRFRDILAASSFGGALRIDHALGLNRQFFIPEGVSATEATYVRFPQNTLLDAIAEVSERTRCIMIGEDLGTVPPGLTEALHDADILSYQVTRWARDEDGGFLPGQEYPRLSLATATTHDIAPIAGWLSGSDIRTRTEVGQLAREDEKNEQAARREEREGLLELWGVSLGDRTDPDAVVTGSHAFLRGCRSLVAMMSLEDLLLQEEMMNLPGTMDEHPNWRRRYRIGIEDWTSDDDVLRRLRAGLR